MEEGGAWSVDRRTVCALGAALGAGCAVLTAIQPPLSRRSAYLLEGVANFRQCGGYPTVDGRTVKWGRLFRAGSLEKASAADLEVIAKLGVATQLDMEGAEDWINCEDPIAQSVMKRARRGMRAIKRVNYGGME